MDLELRISQYIDGELSGEEESELHHMLAVSPEARSLFREHLTLHTVARDERVLHRPGQAMRDDLFARLQAEEGMKPSAAVLVSGSAAVAVHTDARTRVAPDRAPRSLRDDNRPEERRRRRRLIPILVPLLFCVIAGSVWYSGVFNGTNGSVEFAAAEIDANGNGASGPYADSTGAVYSDRDYTESNEITGSTPDRETLALNTASSSISPDRSIARYQPEESVLRSVPAPPPMAAVQSSDETIAQHIDGRERHDVLGNPLTTERDAFADYGESETAANERMAYSESTIEETLLGDFDLAQSTRVDVYDDVNAYPPLQDGMGIALVPDVTSVSRDSRLNVLADGSVSTSVDVAGGGLNIRGGRAAESMLVVGPSELSTADDIVVLDRGPFAMSNGYSLEMGRTFRSGQLHDSVTGKPVTATLDDMDLIAATLRQNGFDIEDDGLAINVNTGSRNMNGLVAYDEKPTLPAADVSGQKGGAEAPVVMGSMTPVEQAPQASDVAMDSTGAADHPALEEPVPVMAANRAAYKRSRSSASRESQPLDASSPRRVSLFVGLDQSIGATVSTVKASIPFPASESFSGNGGLSPETRVVFGFEFDGGRQRVFATFGGWGYDERTSYRSRTRTTSGPVQMVETSIREEERSVYEFWGGAGYRYNIEVSRDWNAGTEIWGGIGENFVHAGMNLPVSYELRDNLRLEIIPGLRYRSLYNTADPVTTGTIGGDSYEERLVTPANKQHILATAGIGLILLFR